MAVYNFTFPENFRPEFQKEYVVAGSKFDVQVQYLGILPKQFAGATAAHMWAFRLIVKGLVIEQGPYYWGVDKRELSLENVANHQASYWGHTKQVEEAQHLAGSPEYELDLIVEKCAAFMHGYFISEDREHTDYDVVSQYMDDEEWVVVLRPNYMPNRLMEFYKTAEMENVEVHSYIEDNELSVKF